MWVLSFILTDKSKCLSLHVLVSHHSTKTLLFLFLFLMMILCYYSSQCFTQPTVKAEQIILMCVMTQMLNPTMVILTNCQLWSAATLLPPALTKSRFRISTYYLSRFDRYKAAFEMGTFPEPGSIES